MVRHFTNPIDITKHPPRQHVGLLCEQPFDYSGTTHLDEWFLSACCERLGTHSHEPPPYPVPPNPQIRQHVGPDTTLPTFCWFFGYLNARNYKLYFRSHFQ